MLFSRRGSFPQTGLDVVRWKGKDGTSVETTHGRGGLKITYHSLHSKAMPFLRKLEHVHEQIKRPRKTETRGSGDALTRTHLK